jgi:hypothetical protein
MKNFLFFLCSLSLVACRDFNSTNTYEFSSQKQVKLTPPITSVESIESPTIKDSYNQEASYIYTVVVDTGSNEHLLRNKMYKLHDKLKIPFMRVLQERSGNTSSDKYVIENGLYPIKFFNQNISGQNEPITWRNSWANNSITRTDFFIYMSLNDHTIMNDDSKSKKTIALIGGVFDSKKSADSALSIFKKEESQAYLLTNRGYIYITSATMSQ